MYTDNDNPRQLSLAEIAEIDEICEDFEGELKSGNSPEIEDWLCRVQASTTVREQLLAELLVVEVELRRHQGEQPTPKEYENRFPNHIELVGKAFGAVKFAIQADDDEKAPVKSLTVASTYLIDKFHARGGLGKIFSASDPQFSRRVAVKFSRETDLGDVQRSRFVREANITGRLEHPGVVPVYAIETDSQQPPSYVMRFVEGQTLRTAIKEFHARNDGNNERFKSMEFRQLLERLISVCHTVAFAHQQGFIHRDIKPGNIMLGDFGETVLLDWGLAKDLRQENETTDRESVHRGETHCLIGTDSGNSSTLPVTAAGQMLGTPSFASPEQRLGNVKEHDQRSDVYSIGATLHYMLTGVRPVEPQASELPEKAANSRLVSERDDSAIPRALRAISRKAMSYESSARYDSAQSLASDLSRYLADEPILAINELPTERLRRWIRRKPGSSAAIVSGFLVGLIALAIGSILLSQKNSELQARNKDLKAARDVARNTTTHAIKALTIVSDDVIHRLLAQKILTDDDREFLRRLKSEYEEFSNVVGSDIESTEIRAEGLLRIGDIHERLGDLSSARKSWQECIGLCSKIETNNSINIEHIHARALAAHGKLITEAGQLESGQLILQDSINRFDALTTRSDSDSILQGASLARRYMGISFVHEQQWSRAQPHFVESTRLLQQLNSRGTPNIRRTCDISLNQNFIGIILTNLKQFSDAQVEFEQVHAKLKTALVQNPHDPYPLGILAAVHAGQGKLLEWKDEMQAAESSYRKAVKISRDLVERFPQPGDYLRQNALYLEFLAKLKVKMGDRQRAETLFDQAVDAGEKLVSDSDSLLYRRLLQRIYASYGSFLEGLGELRRAGEMYHQALELARQNLEIERNTTNVLELADKQNRMASIYRSSGKMSEAVDLFNDSLELVSGIASKDDRQPFVDGVVAIANYGLSTYHLGIREFDQAVGLLDVSLAAAESARKNHVGDNAARMDQLFKSASCVRALCLAPGDPQQSLLAVNETLLESGLKPQHLFNLACACGLAHAYLPEGKDRTAAAQLAVRLLRQAEEQNYFSNRNFARMSLRKRSFQSLRDEQGFQKLIEEYEQPK